MKILVREFREIFKAAYRPDGSSSAILYALAATLRSYGVTVYEHADPREDPDYAPSDDGDGGINGQYTEEWEMIHLFSRGASAFTALLVLCHEAGHWLSYRRHPCLATEPVAVRERLAYLYGWAVCCAVGLKHQRLEWRRMHTDVTG